MKGPFYTLRITLCCAAFTLCSCTARPSGETLRLYLRAGESYAAGNFGETAAMLGAVRNFPPALTLRAKAEYFSGELEKAEASCRQAIRRRPAAFEPRLYMVRILRESGRPVEAAKAVEELLADNPQDLRTLRLAAEIAGEAGKGVEAAAFLDRAAELSAESALVLLDRARLRWIAGRGSEALEDLNRAGAMLPWDTPLLRSIKNLENRIKEAM
jgi:tetratricopeptide (TPR) repeat protein